MVHHATRLGLLASAALLVPGTVLAQGSAPTPTAQPDQSVPEARQDQGAAGALADATATQSSPAENKASEIVVTGSRIARTQFAAPNPITSYNAAAIQNSGNTNITNFLLRVPALTGSLDSTQTAGGNAVYAQPFGQAGLNELDLRHLGTNRTLVLVDGKRHVAGSTFSAAVDINSIPTDLVERVDVLTGPQSAVYGADAVSGVVNFVMKRDFDGFAVDVQNGISSRGDAANHFASITGGRNFADGRGNVTLSYEYNYDARLQNNDRSYLTFGRRQYLIPSGADPASTQPHNVLVGNLRYGGESPIGAVFIGAEGSPSLNGLGQLYRAGTPAAYYTTGLDSDDTPVAGFYSGDLLPKIERQNVNLLTHYDFSDAFKLSFQGKFVQTNVKTFDYYNAIYYQPIAADNPYIPAGVSAAAAAALAAPGADPTAGDIHVNRDNLDYGRHGEEDRRRTYRAVIDATGRLTEHATYDAYFEYGRTDVRINKLNETIGQNYQDAIDAVRDPATGQIRCRSAAAVAAGCLPVNLFGAGPIDRQALGYFQVNDVSRARVSQQVANASVSGDFGQFFSLPGGPIQFSFGGEYRRESSEFNPSANLRNGAFQSYNEPTVVVPSAGHFNVKEAFGELNVPILKERPFAEILSVGAAYRYSSYSTVGSTNTWQFNGIYAPVRDISFRGSYGKAVRAPNIQELFQPTSGTTSFIVDPCSTDELNHGTQYRAANCVALLQRYGVSYANTDAIKALQTGNNVFGVTSGNSALQPETARTWTAGVVLRPRWLQGLILSVDWFDIKLKNAINVAAAGQLPGLCVDQPTIDNQFCGLVTRQQGTAKVTSFVTQPQNVANFTTSGADLNVNYVANTTRAGSFDLRLVGGYLHRLKLIPLPGAVAVDNRNQFGSPKWNFTFSPTWTLGGLTVAYNLRWNDRTRTQAKQVTDSDPYYAAADRLRYKALWQHDLQILYKLEAGLALYVGATNLTDQKPDPGNSTNAPISPLGRYFYAGFKYAFKRQGG